MPPAIARLLGVAAVVVLSITLVDGVLLQGAMSALDSSFKTSEPGNDRRNRAAR